ncbi:cyclic GMP-AMP synthase-like protein isoform X1 [Zeugodacus cucurbitae]|uniref:cyclic GMP-AMP synthase-like protein isoform X1 n=1 Tax=Zeugodacus cucurbitae TaxID=28588 RepID=UPI000596904C|nr:cyclic GMP-AMP synthase-like protein isoform X1 [Zeugodacus cucurbitae]XP_011191184.1 cyclic GMP-AMP synthase-like protein isoform X1 [Zeugodacus cucurbitae]XP_054090748.1 cyclic GMP-AMP synthase-like protein isoform X1 [Zeugodacus cucurbitae]XP_054090749.1 cyclic GMP-AMP synthase-like protein isoform X1 [Zeugodacus cucurbitae]
MAPGNYEKYLAKIVKKLTISDEDRAVYVKDFEIIRDHILTAMCEVDHVFDTIYKGPILFDNYPNNVHIKYPNKFDVIFKLSIPCSSYIEVDEDDERPGFVNLNFQKLMRKLSEYDDYDDIYNRLLELLDRNGNLLCRSNLQNWLKNVIKEGLENCGDFVRGNWGDLYTLIYTSRGFAHNIYAKCSNRVISIDFVPGLSFDIGTADWIDVRHCRKYRNKCEEWYAVPKPTNGLKATRRYAFMIRNPKVEYDLLLENQNLNIVFRILKSLRNAYGMHRLTSYFITTALLWEIELQNKIFWDNPIYIILEHMLETLARHFGDGCLLFFWNRDLNLLEYLHDDEIEDYAAKLKKVHNTLRQYKTEPNLSYKRCKTHFQLPC